MLLGSTRSKDYVQMYVYPPVPMYSTVYVPTYDAKCLSYNNNNYTNNYNNVIS